MSVSSCSMRSDPIRAVEARMTQASSRQPAPAAARSPQVECPCRGLPNTVRVQTDLEEGR